LECPGTEARQPECMNYWEILCVGSSQNPEGDSSFFPSST